MMKRVNIQNGTVGMVSRNGNYIMVLTAGKHWIYWGDVVKIYEMSKLYLADVNFSLKMQDENFADLIEIIDIKDNEIAFKFNEGLFTSIIGAGRYFYWKGLMKFDFKIVSLDKIDITEDIDKSLLNRTMVRSYVNAYEIGVNEKGLLFVDGHLDRIMNRGTHYFWKNSQKVNMVKVDLRQKQMEISGQEILTKDKAALRINFFTLYKVIDVKKAVIETNDYEKQFYILIQLALREFIGGLSLDELLENKEQVSTYVISKIAKKANEIGIEMIDAGIKDIILTGEMKDIMNQVLIAQKKAQANIITRREETASTRSLLNTAKLMEDNNMLFRLKEMEYVEKISEKVGQISVTGNGQVLDQLKHIFGTSKG